jgi:hypothetical protein
VHDEVRRESWGLGVGRERFSEDAAMIAGIAQYSECQRKIDLAEEEDGKEFSCHLLAVHDGLTYCRVAVGSTKICGHLLTVID